MPIFAEVKDIVKNIGKNTKFLQPMYEAIVNAFEANASVITITLFSDDELFEDARITGFSITDNGDGFNENNRNAFNSLWTDNKRSIGCKGSGRFTWLSVFKTIKIESYVKEEQKKICIPFDLEYSHEKMRIIDFEVKDNLTTISFSGVNDAYYFASKKKIHDSRESANPIEIKNKILEYLLIKLFLMKKNDKEFHINIVLNDDKETISNSDIPDLTSAVFDISSSLTEEDISFTLYYIFFKDGKNSKKMYLCANERSTKTIDDDSLGFSTSLPEKDSFIMLLCSDYFEGKDNDSRSDFETLSYLKKATKEYPLLIGEILREAKKKMGEIILEHYPEISEINRSETEKAISKVPYLTQFIMKNDELLKSEKSLIVSALKTFNEVKLDVKNRFDKVLSYNNVESEEFAHAVDDLNSIAIAELGEYILFRDNIIKALDKIVQSTNTKEKAVHDLFMPMRTHAVESDIGKHLLSNLWLIDDKYMTYYLAASDLTVKQICNEIETHNSKIYKSSTKPDLSIFFNSESDNKDAIIVEFKGPNASKDEKNKSLTELPNNISVVRKNITGIRTIWSYIITTIDDEFSDTIDNSDVFIKLFSKSSNHKSYYRFLKNNNAHVFIVDLRTIIEDAFARNKTFLDILKNPVLSKITEQVQE